MSCQGRTLIHTRLRPVLVWLLALLLPMQAMAAGVFTVMGPAHFHKPSQAPLVLNDFRRWHPSPVPQAAAFAFSGHSHGAATQQRHHHARGDASVVRSGQDGPMNSLDADEGPSAAASLASVLAILLDWPAWKPCPSAAPPASHAGWALLTGFDQPPDRPPMRG